VQSFYPPSFDREMACTEREWLMWLQGAVRDQTLTLGAAEAGVDIEGGSLRLTWQVLAPRQIALMRLPRLAVQFRFGQVDGEARQRFMRYFDLYMQRGGG
jgi:hypothetical protein